MRGRPPKPETLRLIEGNLGKRALPAGTPEPPAVAGQPAPAHLVGAAKDLWDVLEPQLGQYVGLAGLDLLGLELLCASYGRYRKALDGLREVVDGVEVERTTYQTRGRNGTQIKTRPELVQALEEMRLMKSLMAEYGLTPAARVRLKGIGQMGLPFDDGLDQLNRQYGGARS